MAALTMNQFDLVYNAFSFTIATMGAATLFFWLGRSQVSHHYRTPLTLAGLVTAIAFYHYVRIFESWSAAYTIANYTIAPSGKPFNDAYRYVDWLLTVPLLLIELILVMRLSEAETWSKSVRLGALAAAMVILGYPGEVSTDASTKVIFWSLAMIPFLVIVYELYTGLSAAIASQPPKVQGLVKAARNVTVITWCFYPIVFFLPLMGLPSSATLAAVQVGYTIADMIAKAGFGTIIYLIAMRKSDAEGFSGRRTLSKMA
jgi:bacteriorhodopsin